MPIPPTMLEVCYQEYADIKDLKRQNEVLELYKECYPEKVEKFICDYRDLIDNYNFLRENLLENLLKNFDDFYSNLNNIYKNEKEITLMVIGNTDRDGSLDYNLILSKKRAEAV